MQTEAFTCLTERMAESVQIKIDTTETFPRLSRAPIVEAVIELRTRAEAGTWNESEVAGLLKTKLPEYTTIRSMRGFSMVYGYRTLNAMEVVLYQELGEQPQAPWLHRFG
jgi:hypothetical protein